MSALLAIARRRHLLDTNRLHSTPWTLKAEVQKKLEHVLEDREMNNIEKPPPFHVSEMIVIAIVMSDKESVSAFEIFRQMLKCFKYYNHKAIEDYMAGNTFYWDLCDGPPMLPHFYEGFDTWEAPLYGAKDDSVPNHGGKHLSPNYLKYDPIRTPTQAKDLFDLPPELRKEIFEYVLIFEHPGLVVRWEGFKLYRRKNEDMVCSASVDGVTLQGPAVQTLLALFSVNKQCYTEALPIFYARNWFAFDTPYEFAKFVQQTTDERLGLIKNVIVHFSSTYRALKGYELGANALSKQTGLKNLELVVSDTSWFDAEAVRKEYKYGAKVFSKPQELPGISNIAFALSNASHFKVTGDCPQIRKYLLNEVLKLKTAEKEKEVAGLRRAEKLREARSFKEAAGLSNLESTKSYGLESKYRTANGTSASGRSSSGKGRSSTGPRTKSTGPPLRDSSKRSHGSASSDPGRSDGRPSKRRRV